MPFARETDHWDHMKLGTGELINQMELDLSSPPKNSGQAAMQEPSAEHLNI
jgi:hypothetical protein